MKDKLIKILNAIIDEGRVYDKTKAFAYRIDNSQIAAFLISRGVIVTSCDSEEEKDEM